MSISMEVAACLGRRERACYGSVGALDFRSLRMVAKEQMLAEPQIHEEAERVPAIAVPGTT
jgi:hypothetical protein